MLPLDLSNVIYEYLIPFELRLSHLKIRECQPNMLATKSGWVYTKVVDGSPRCRSTFSGLDVPCVFVATQFWDHAGDSDVIVLLVQNSQKEGHLDVETWEARDAKRIATFPLDYSLVHRKDNLIHLPCLQRILSWKGGYSDERWLRLIDYTGTETDRIDFTRDVRFLDMVEDRLLFQKKISPVDSSSIRSKILINGTHPRMEEENACVLKDARSLYWLNLSSCVLAQDNTRRLENYNYYRFYRRCYSSREIEFDQYDLQDDWQLRKVSHSYIIRLEMITGTTDACVGFVEELDLERIELLAKPTSEIVSHVKIQCGTRREFILHFGVSGSSFLVSGRTS
jgi:hypothetical protein